MGRTQRRRRQRKVNTKREVGGTQRGDDISNNIGAIFKYLHRLGWSNENALTVRYFSRTGRGLCSKSRRFDVGEQIIKLPVSGLITIETLEKDVAFKAYFNFERLDKDLRIPFQSLLAIYILYQKHLGENSDFNAYLSTLPKKFSVPYFCTMRELQCLPDAVLERTVAQNRLIKESYASLCQTIVSHQCQCCGRDIFNEIFPLQSFKWAYFVVNTRSVYINSMQMNQDKVEKRFFTPQLLRDDTNLALAPFLDLLNHSDKVTTTAELILNASAGVQCLEYVLTLQDAVSKSIPRYSQIFISYGTLANLKLYTEYGFVLEWNTHDFFELSLNDIERFLKEETCFAANTIHRNKFKFIRERNLHDQMFVHNNDGVSHNLRVVLHLLLKESSHFSNVLNQVAFGAVTHLDEMKEEVDMLIRFKINEYKGFLSTLETLEPKALSDSGAMAIIYLRESLRYLESCLELP